MATRHITVYDAQALWKQEILNESESNESAVLTGNTVARKSWSEQYNLDMADNLIGVVLDDIGKNFLFWSSNNKSYYTDYKDYGPYADFAYGDLAEKKPWKNDMKEQKSDINVKTYENTTGKLNIDFFDCSIVPLSDVSHYVYVTNNHNVRVDFNKEHMKNRPSNKCELEVSFVSGQKCTSCFEWNDSMTHFQVSFPDNEVSNAVLNFVNLVNYGVANHINMDDFKHYTGIDFSDWNSAPKQRMTLNDPVTVTFNPAQAINVKLNPAVPSQPVVVPAPVGSPAPVHIPSVTNQNMNITNPFNIWPGYVAPVYQDDDDEPAETQKSKERKEGPAQCVSCNTINEYLGPNDIEGDYVCYSCKKYGYGNSKK